MIHETPGYLANEVVCALPPKTQPDCVVDLGCGRGAILEAALRKFPGVTALGVDVRMSAVHEARCRLEGKARVLRGDATHHGFLKRALSRVGVTRRDNIAFVGNPPFSRNPRWRPQDEAARVDAELREHCPPYVRSTYPYQFLVTQLALAGNDGVVSNIVPRTVVVGNAWQDLREYFRKAFQIMRSDQVGYHRFSGREVGVGIFALSVEANVMNSQRVELTSGRTLGALASDIRRGTPVVRSRHARRKILHSSSADGALVRPVARKFGERAQFPRGDVLTLLRVARSAGRVVYVRRTDRTLPFSDCLSVVHLPRGYEGALSIVYWSDQFRSERFMPQRGTGARYLTNPDIKALPVPDEFPKWRPILATVFARHRRKLEEGNTQSFFTAIERALLRQRVELTFSDARGVLETHGKPR